MVQYFDDYEVACIDGRSFRLDKRSGYYLSSAKIDGKRKRLHVYVWERENGKLATGYDVHHVDGNKRNNDIGNLVLVSRKEHALIHGTVMSESRRQVLAKNVTEKAMPKAKAWHKTEAGAEWHKAHAKKIWEDAKERRYVCTFCGKEYFTRNAYSKFSNTFCSNRCKSAFRRASGVDNIIRICEACGNEYTVNKYQKTRFCPDCKHKKNAG